MADSLLSPENDFRDTSTVEMDAVGTALEPLSGETGCAPGTGQERARPIQRRSSVSILIGSAVVYFICSIAKLDVTFESSILLISFL